MKEAVAKSAAKAAGQGPSVEDLAEPKAVFKSVRPMHLGGRRLEPGPWSRGSCLERRPLTALAELFDTVGQNAGSSNPPSLSITAGSVAPLQAEA